jgi:hypothetical protein
MKGCWMKVWMVADARSRRVAVRRGNPQGPRWLAALCLLLAVGCYTQQPKRETAPSATPPAPPPPAEVQAAPSAPQQSVEQKGEAPTDDTAQHRPGSGATGAPLVSPPAASAPLAPSKKSPTKARKPAQLEAERDRSDRSLGGAGSEAPSDELRQRLDRAYRAGSPDCPSARERKKAVCDLAGQICQLIDRDPNVASVAEYCADAKERCAEAERRTIERCPE